MPPRSARRLPAAYSLAIPAHRSSPAEGHRGPMRRLKTVLRPPRIYPKSPGGSGPCTAPSPTRLSAALTPSSVSFGGFLNRRPLRPRLNRRPLRPRLNRRPLRPRLNRRPLRPRLNRRPLRLRLNRRPLRLRLSRPRLGPRPPPSRRRRPHTSTPAPTTSDSTTGRRSGTSLPSRRGEGPSTSGSTPRSRTPGWRFPPRTRRATSAPRRGSSGSSALKGTTCTSPRAPWARPTWSSTPRGGR